MNELIEKEIEIYLNKIEENNSIRETWVNKNLPNVYNFLSNKDGEIFSEKLYIYKNGKSFCKICNSKVHFLSYKRGYREYCSKSCSNSDPELCDKKLMKYKKTNLKRWGVEIASKSYFIREKIKNSKLNLNQKEIYEKSKKTNLKRWGKENPSQNNEIKQKKKLTTLKNWGVENPFQSRDIKEKIKRTNLEKYGFDHPLKNELVKIKSKNTSLENWGVDNYTKSKEYKELMFNKWRSGLIKTNLNTDPNHISYVGLGIHNLRCDNGLGHTYETNSHLYHARKGFNNKQCTICFPVNSTSSFKEEELFYFIKSVYDGDIIRSYKDGIEIDIYLPELKIGFEFNGLYWHSELFKDKNYHKDKTNYFSKKGIRVIHIWEDDWNNRKEILKSQIKNWIGKSDRKIWARNCQIKEIKLVDEYRVFLNENHIQEYTSSTIKIGLYYNNELISLMTFDKFEGRKKMKQSEWNLSRFCNKINTSVVGGASKLLNYFIENWSPSRLISFSDNSWSNGDLYNKLGFNLISKSYPNYSYIIDRKRSNKQKWKKSNLIKMGFPKELSESKIMEDNFGSYKIFDCGQTKFELTFIM